MTRWVLRPFFAAVFVLALLYLGQIVDNLTGWAPSPLVPKFLQLDIGYIQKLSSEIGGSGIDALLVGWIAGYVIARMDRQRDAELQRSSLRRRRALKGKANIVAELSTGASRLPLAGFDLVGGEIENLHLVAPRFFEHGRWARFLDLFRNASAPLARSLTSICFRGCQIAGARFGGATAGVELKLCQFERCDVRGSDFRNTKFFNDAGLAPFVDTTLTRCCFVSAQFFEASLEDTRLRWCSFWGASFENSRLPGGWFNALRDADCLVFDKNRPSYYGVRPLREILLGPSRARLHFLMRYCVGSRFPNSDLPVANA